MKNYSRVDTEGGEEESERDERGCWGEGRNGEYGGESGENDVRGVDEGELADTCAS